MNPPNICHKCGLDHNNPVGERECMLVLACAMRGITFITRDGKVPTPNIEDYVR